MCAAKGSNIWVIVQAFRSPPFSSLTPSSIALLSPDAVRRTKSMAPAKPSKSLSSKPSGASSSSKVAVVGLLLPPFLHTVGMHQRALLRVHVCMRSVASIIGLVDVQWDRLREMSKQTWNFKLLKPWRPNRLMRWHFVHVRCKGVRAWFSLLVPVTLNPLYRCKTGLRGSRTILADPWPGLTICFAYIRCEGGGGGMAWHANHLPLGIILHPFGREIVISWASSNCCSLDLYLYQFHNGHSVVWRGWCACRWPCPSRQWKTPMWQCSISQLLRDFGPDQAWGLDVYGAHLTEKNACLF